MPLSLLYREMMVCKGTKRTFFEALSPLQFRVRATKAEMRSICRVQNSVFEKARKTAKNEEKRRKLAVFQMRSKLDTRDERRGQFRCTSVKNRLLRVFPEKANDQFRCKMSFANVQNRCVFIPTNRNLSYRVPFLNRDRCRPIPRR